MPRVTRQPSDETADTGVQAGAGEVTDVALGGFPARPGLGVTLRITYQLDTFADSEVGTSTTRARIRHSTNGGSSWTTTHGIFSQTINTVPADDTDTEGATLASTSIGDINDLSQIQLQAFSENVFTGDGSGTSRAQLLDWEVRYHTAVGIVQA